MFGKKCFKCGGSVKGDFDFCPFCGNSVKSIHDREDYGFLGKNDFVAMNSRLHDPFVERLFNNTMKLFEQHMKHFQREVARDVQSVPRHKNNLHIQFFVNGKKVFPYTEHSPAPKINVGMIQEKFQKSAQLPREEPASKLMRISGKLIYELEVPGVMSVEDVLINRLENSIEIKALSDKKIYSKKLNLNLPVLNYKLHKGILTLELQGR